MSKNLISVEEIIEVYGVDLTMFPNSSYYINEQTGILVISDRSKIAFEGRIKPKDVVHGSYSDSYFYYFTKLEGEQ